MKAPKSASGESAGFLLQRAHNLLRERMIAALDGTGIHLGHLAILGFLEGSGSLTQRELCAQTGIEKSSMVIFLDHLEKEKWLTRGTHPTDRRAHAVTLTEPGIRRLRSLQPQLRQVEKEFLSGLTPRQQDSLRSLLMLVVKSQPNF